MNKQNSLESGFKLLAHIPRTIASLMNFAPGSVWSFHHRFDKKWKVLMTWWFSAFHPRCQCYVIKLPKQRARFLVVLKSPCAQVSVSCTETARRLLPYPSDIVPVWHSLVHQCCIWTVRAAPPCIKLQWQQKARNNPVDEREEAYWPYSSYSLTYSYTDGISCLPWSDWHQAGVLSQRDCA